MRTTQITRDTLKRYIDRAIEQAGNLTDSQANALREVAETTTAVRVGDYFTTPMCPAAQAGLIGPRSDEPDPDSVVASFARLFDEIAEANHGCYQEILAVV
jgi:hypothetical protein